MITTVNYHIKKACNYSCKFCFAQFNGACESNAEEHEKIVRMVCQRDDFRKINFVGGEPTLLSDELVKLIKMAKEGGKVTSVTTNGSLLNEDWFAKVQGSLDMLTVSIDSSMQARNLEIGRATRKRVPANKEHYLDIAKWCEKYGIQLKINTVVCSYNKNDKDMAVLINELAPFRWKLFQALCVKGENDATAEDFSVTAEEFDAYVKRHRALLDRPDIMVPESNELMQGSYLMIGPDGRFFDNTKGCYTKSDKLVEVGIDKALTQINFDDAKFIERGGEYTVPTSETEKVVEQKEVSEMQTAAVATIPQSKPDSTSPAKEKRQPNASSKIEKLKNSGRLSKKTKTKKTRTVVEQAPSPLEQLTGRKHIGIYGKTDHFRERQRERCVDDYTLEKVLNGVTVNNHGKMCVIANVTYLQQFSQHAAFRNLVILLDLDSKCLITVFDTNDAYEYLRNKMDDNFKATVILQ